MILPLLLISSFVPNPICGKIIDHSDGLPICNALVYSGRDSVYTNPDGSFQLNTSNEKVFVEALGFKTKELTNSLSGVTVYLEPLLPGSVVCKKKK